MSGPVPDGSDRGPGSLKRHLVRVFGGEKAFMKFSTSIVEIAVDMSHKKMDKRMDAVVEMVRSQAPVNAAIGDGLKHLAAQLAIAERNLATMQRMIEDRSEISSLLPGRIRALESRISDLETSKADHAGS